MPSCAGGGHGSSLPPPCSSFVCDACGQPTLALLLEKKRKRPWLWTQNKAKFLGLVALRVSSAGSSVFWCHHPEIQLRKGLTGVSPVCTLSPYEGKRSLMGKTATPKLSTWVIFPNWLRTNMLKSGMKSGAGWQGGVGAAPPQLLDLWDLPLATAGSKTSSCTTRRAPSGWVPMPAVLRPPRPAAAGRGMWCRSPTYPRPLERSSSASSTRLTASTGVMHRQKFPLLFHNQPGLMLSAAEDAPKKLFWFPSGQ